MGGQKMNRDLIKTALRQSGLFPVVRSAYRRFNSTLRAERKREICLYSSILKSGGRCFDIGANLGQRSEVFLELGNSVLIVEPNPECRPTLDFLFARNPNASIAMVAIGASEGSIEFYSHGTDSTGSMVPGWDSMVFGRHRKQVARTVPMTTLDSLISKYGRPDFTKIDVEGFEIDVFKGLSQPLPLLSFEFHSNDMLKTRVCLDYLRTLGEISVRACTMDCRWIGAKTDNVAECLFDIETKQANGDLFVWSSL
jgi:FkbM family methyltransferase